MNRQESIEHACQTVGLAYRSMADYSNPSDCFCNTPNGWNYQNAGEVLEFVRQAVIEKLTREGFTPRLDLFEGLTT